MIMMMMLMFVEMVDDKSIMRLMQCDLYLPISRSNPKIMHTQISLFFSTSSISHRRSHSLTFLLKK